MLNLIRGTGLRAPFEHPLDALWDLRLGIRTFGYIPAVGEHASGTWQAHYQPTGYGALFRIFRQLQIGEDDIYIDLGAGLGRTVFVADRFGARRSIGVEIDSRLHLGAMRNRERLRSSGSRIEFHQISAADFDFSDTTAIFLYHPFGAQTLASVVSRIDESLEQNPRYLRIAYLNPVHASELDASRFLEPWQPTTDSLDPDYEVRFWRTSASGPA